MQLKGLQSTMPRFWRELFSSRLSVLSYPVPRVLVEPVRKPFTNGAPRDCAPNLEILEVAFRSEMKSYAEKSTTVTAARDKIGSTSVMPLTRSDSDCTFPAAQQIQSYALSQSKYPRSPASFSRHPIRLRTQSFPR